jgi:Glycosyl hydrolases family 16
VILGARRVSRLVSVLGVAVLALLAGAAPAVADPAVGAAGRAPAVAWSTASGGLPPRCTPTGGPVVPRPAPRRALAAGLLPALLGAVAREAAAAAPITPPSAPPCSSAGRSTGDETSAAVLHGWGTPARVEEFDGPKLGPAWGVYNGPGHGGNGRRTPKAVGLRDGIMTITGDARGDTAGMEWGQGQRYGRWEGRVKAPASDPSYNALLLLWPDAENFPVGGEIDFMEMMDHTRQKTNVFLHYGRHNDQVSGSVRADATQWHNWAVEWTPTHIAKFLDGKEWWRTERTAIFPPGKMHLCVQLDWFPGDARGRVRPSTMQVDWVKQYTLSPADLARSAADDAARAASVPPSATPSGAVAAPSAPAVYSSSVRPQSGHPGS